MKVNLAILCLAVVAWGQEPASFEVASVRLNTSGSAQDSGINISDGGRITGTNLTMRTLIQQAYGVLPFQLAGGPAWLDKDRYDIEAKTGRLENLNQSQLRPLLQNLLADRFRLRVHREAREMIAYALVVDKSGLKIKTNNDSISSNLSTQNVRQASGKARVMATAASMGQLAFTLEKLLGRIVVDNTGLSGGYDFNLEWELDQSADNSGPSLFTALREQLGLRVESRKEPVETIVIDSAEKASEN